MNNVLCFAKRGQDSIEKQHSFKFVNLNTVKKKFNCFQVWEIKAHIYKYCTN